MQIATAADLDRMIPLRDAHLIRDMARGALAKPPASRQRAEALEQIDRIMTAAIEEASQEVRA